MLVIQGIRNRDALGMVRACFMMTPEQRSEWLELRKTGIGGSEVASLLSGLLDTKYGCAHRLWREKSGIPADYEFNDSGPVKLGRLMEGPVCDIYASMTGRRVEELPRQVHPEHPELGVSIDRLIHAPDKEGPGVLEAKCMLSRNFFITKREGLILDYLCQAQHGILVASASLGIDIQWCSFVVGRSDDPELIAFALEWNLKMNPAMPTNPSYLIHFDVPRNNQICEAILREGPRFWRTLGDADQAPPKLEPDSPVCGRCQWRDGCHGSSLLPADTSAEDLPIASDLAPLAQEIIERQVIFDQAEEMLAESKEIAKLMLGDRQAVRVQVGSALRNLYYRQQDGRPLYGDAVKNMSQQYNVLREKLIQIEKTGDPNLAAGAELVPTPSTFVKKGKPFRALMTQYLSPSKKEEA